MNPDRVAQAAPAPEMGELRTTHGPARAIVQSSERNVDIEADAFVEALASSPMRMDDKKRNTIIFYGSGKNATVELKILERITYDKRFKNPNCAIFIDPLVEPMEKGTLNGVELKTAKSVSEARYMMARETLFSGDNGDGVARQGAYHVCAIVGVQFQITSSSYFLDVPKDISFRSPYDQFDQYPDATVANKLLLSAVEYASIAGLFWDAEDAPYLSLKFFPNDSHSLELVKSKIVSSTCKVKAVDFAKDCIAQIKNAEQSYNKQAYKHDVFLSKIWPFDKGQLPLRYELLFMCFARLGPVLVEKVVDKETHPLLWNLSRSIRATLVPDSQETMSRMLF